MCCLLAAAFGAVQQDEILALPGWPGPLWSKQYSGYLTVGSKHFHYWLVLSQNNPDTSPTVLWLNGGPGCSSLDGLVYEHGPFRINDTDPTKIYPFEQTWSTIANTLYLEAPVGVGFSYSDDKADYITNDDKTAQDNVQALMKFFDLYPEYRKNDFYITGESYAGVYIPTLAEGIMWAEGNGTWTGAPLKGIAVGNGCTGNSIGSCGGERDRFSVQYILGTALISADLKAAISAACNFTKTDGPTAQCNALLLEMHAAIGHVDLYNVYGPCISGSSMQEHGHLTAKAPVSPPGALSTPPLAVSLGGPDACIDSILGSAYLNSEAVIAATHVVKQSFKWSTCGNQISYSSTRPNLPRDTYPALIKKYRVVIYNGDWDLCVPYTDNEDWTESMGYPVDKAWHPWSYSLNSEGKVTEQVAGYATTYAANGFTFVTVKGGRHEVPETAPDQALELLKRLITGAAF